MTNLLEFKNVCKNFGEKQILKNINLEIKPNKIIGVIGQNGSGKTSMFKLINDLFTISSGEILFLGKPISVESKKQISYLPERTYFDKNTTVLEALKIFETFYEDFDRQKLKYGKNE